LGVPAQNNCIDEFCEHGRRRAEEISRTVGNMQIVYSVLNNGLTAGILFMGKAHYTFDAEFESTKMDVLNSAHFAMSLCVKMSPR
jgi:hypothetical protein